MDRKLIRNSWLGALLPLLWISVAAQEIVAEGVVSTARNQTFPSVDPVSGDLWFSEYNDSFDEQTILVSHQVDETWQHPEVASFSGKWGDRAPRFSPDGSSIYFTSNRPVVGREALGDMNIWKVARSDEGWGEPTFVDSPVNSESSDMHASVSENGIWVASRREGGLGQSDIYRIDTDGSVDHLPPPLNDEHSQSDLWISADESWMILVITNYPGGFGGDDLYISFRDGDVWSTPVNLGTAINTPEYEYGPSVSPDEQFLYYSSHRAGPSHIYRIPLAPILDAGAVTPVF